MKILFRVVLFVLPVLVAPYGFGLGGVRGVHAQEQPPPQAMESMKQLIVRVSGRCGNAEEFGSGILVGVGTDRLYIATARHVIWCGPEREAVQDIRVELRSMPGEPMSAKLLSQYNPSLDLAVLVIPGIHALGIPVEAIPFDHLGDSRMLQRGDPLYFVGHPAGRFWETNIIPDRLSEKRGDILRFQSSGIAEGVSGGGLFDERQKLVGMIIHDAPPESEAIAIEKVLEQLRIWGDPLSLQYKETLMDISGEWLGEKLRHENRYIFSFDMRGTRVFGSVRRAGFAEVRGILDGKVENDTISFRVREMGSRGSTFDAEFNGKIEGENISFIRQYDTGEPLTRLTATRRGGTQLHKAVAKGQLEDIKSVLASGVDIQATDNFGDTALHSVIRKRLQALSKKGDKRGEAPKWLEIIRLLVEKGADPNKADLDGKPPLEMVLPYRGKNYDMETAKILLAHGADPNRQPSGHTLLHEAACSGYAELTQALISAGADLDVLNKRAFCLKKDQTPLFLAVYKKQRDIVRLLLEAGADVNAGVPGNNKALNIAVVNEDEKVVKMLLRAGADVDGIGHRDNTPLLNACSQKTARMSKLLLDAGADVTKRGEHGKGALDCVVAREEAGALIKRILDAGASVGDRRKNGRTALHVAAAAGRVENIRLLLELGADINARDNEGNTPLHDATYGSWRGPEAVELLLGAGASVKAVNKEGNTPLHILVLASTKKKERRHRDEDEHDYFAAAKVLIAKGAELSARNNRYDTPLDIATQGEGAIAKLLRAHGAAGTVQPK